jgi:hypothetical protein
MMESSELISPDLQSFQEAVARSPIFVRQLALDALLADWERTRLSVDVDAVVLAWIARHGRGRKPLALA